MDKVTWEERMGNLLARRAKGEFSKDRPGGFASPSVVGDYKSHLSKFKIGKSVLDVGCGNAVVRDLLPENVAYTGIDPFPCGEGIIKTTIEELDLRHTYDTVICFAALDGVLDLGVALMMINIVAKQNVCLLTGLDIPVNEYHTYEINLDNLKKGLPAFSLTFSEELSPKVWLLEFTKCRIK